MNFALVGCGRISKRYLDILTQNTVKDARLVAVCDSNEVRATATAQKFDIPSYTDYHEMMMREDVDVVCVLTPSGLHANHVIDLARYKKHIIVEKPMALTLPDADAMIRACDENVIKLFVVKQNRFNIPVQHLRAALDEGRFGKLVLGTVRVRWCRPQEYYDQDAWRGTWELDGGILANQASHHVDLLEWMMGPVESVLCHLQSLSCRHRNRRYRPRDPQVHEWRPRRC